MAKVLVTAHLGRHFRIFGHYDYKVLLEMGHEVHIAANFQDELDRFEDLNVTKHQIDFARNPFSFDNLKAVKQLKILFDKNHYEIIHCQSPSGGAVTRVSAKRTRKRGSQLIYTAHGFHFFKGARIRNWMLYFIIEYILAISTDMIITINDEDYKLANKKLPTRNIKKINGVGIDLGKFQVNIKNNKFELRKKYGYKVDDILIIFAGELSYRKHQDLAIKAIQPLIYEYPQIKLLLAGTGVLMSRYQELVNKLNLGNHVQFLGYRNDITNLMLISDIAISTSRQEGLPVNIMEAMAAGLPIVATDCRGNRDLVKDGQNGYIVNINDVQGFSDKIKLILESCELKEKFSRSSLELIKKYSYKEVKTEMIEIYKEIL